MRWRSIARRGHPKENRSVFVVRVMKDTKTIGGNEAMKRRSKTVGMGDVGMTKRLGVGRQGVKAAVVCMSIIVFFAMALVPPIANADCSEALVECYKDLSKLGMSGTPVGTYTTSACWHWDTISFCRPCASDDDLNKQCNDKFPKCEGRCTAVTEIW
jgi:hypothetical protein